MNDTHGAPHMSMTITRFRYFNKVARLGSIREAADVLFVAPSAISRQISRLEEQLGVSLFEPHGRGLRLTAAGQILAQHTNHVLDTLDRAASEIDELAGLKRGHVRIWTAEGSVSDMVVPAIAAFRAKFPEVTYEVTISGTDRIVRAVLEDDADLAVVFNPPPEPELMTIRTSTGPLLAVGHPRHPAMTQPKLTLAEVATHALALPDTSFGLRHLIDAAAKASGLAIKPTLVTNSIEALRSYARLNAGLTLLPRTSVAWDLRRHSLKVVPIVDKSLRKGTTSVLVRNGRVLTIAASEFMTHLISTIETLEN